MLYEYPNVGENLQDHVLLPPGFKAASRELLFESLLKGTYHAEAVAKYTQNHTGPLSAVTIKAYVCFRQILVSLGKGPISAPFMKTVLPIL